jgi:hypothetical protein
VNSIIRAFFNPSTPSFERIGLLALRVIEDTQLLEHLESCSRSRERSERGYGELRSPGVQIREAAWRSNFSCRSFLSKPLVP